MEQVAVAVGLCAFGAYVLGSVPFGWLLTRRRLRRDLRRFEAGSLDVQLRTLLAGGTGGADTTAAGAGARPAALTDDLVAAVLDTAKVLIAGTVAWRVVEGFSPPFNRAQLPPLSGVGFLADQVLTSWQSAAIWTGLAAVVGHLRPPRSLGRLLGSGGGQAPALGLAFVYLPLGFAAGVVASLVTLAARRRLPIAVLAGLTAFVAYAWTAWIFDWDPSWGAVNGPELTLWAAVLAGVVVTHTPR